MTKRANEKASMATIGSLKAARHTSGGRLVSACDVTALVGIKSIARHAAVAETHDNSEVIEVPQLDQLTASIAVIRCLMPQRLRGYEVKAMRKIMGMTLAEMAEKLDEKTAVETVSRWESEAQPMGGYAEKVLRLLVCEQLRERAPGVAYDGKMIALLRQVDPWRVDQDYELPAVEVELVKVQCREGGGVCDAWIREAA